MEIHARPAEQRERDLTSMDARRRFRCVTLKWGWRVMRTSERCRRRHPASSCPMLPVSRSSSSTKRPTARPSRTSIGPAKCESHRGANQTAKPADRPAKRERAVASRDRSPLHVHDRLRRVPGRDNLNPAVELARPAADGFSRRSPRRRRAWHRPHLLLGALAPAHRRASSASRERHLRRNAGLSAAAPHLRGCNDGRLAACVVAALRIHVHSRSLHGGPSWKRSPGQGSPDCAPSRKVFPASPMSRTSGC
jgi:hypothetical protein